MWRRRFIIFSEKRDKCNGDFVVENDRGYLRKHLTKEERYGKIKVSFCRENEMIKEEYL